MRLGFRALAALLLVFAAPIATAQPAPAPTSTVQVQRLPPVTTAEALRPVFDAQKATDAYLATVKGEARARSDSYFEGGYVLLVVDTVYAIVVAGLLLWLRISAWMRDVAQRITRSRFLQGPIYRSEEGRVGEECRYRGAP